MKTASKLLQGGTLSELLCDFLCILFAIWTLCSNGTVKTGGHLTTLLTAYPIVTLVLLVFAIRFRDILFRILKPENEQQGSLGERKRFQALHVFSAILGFFGVLIFIVLHSYVVLWWLISVTLAFGIIFMFLRGPSKEIDQRRCLRSEVFLWMISLICSILALMSHRFDPDDSLYVNFAVSAVDISDWPLLRTDTQHGIPDLPLHLPAYKLHSYELLNGAISFLTGIPVIYCFHFISTAIAALFVPLAYAKLFRYLTPRHWIASVTTVIAILVCVGETHQWYGNFSLFRLWQGKSIYLSVFLPLIYANAIRFAYRPTVWSWGILAASQISAVGCTSSALWSAPVAAALAVSAAIQPYFSLRNLKIIVLGLLSSTYVLGVALYLKSSTQGAIGLSEVQENNILGENLGIALVSVLGESRILIFGILAIAISWAVSPSSIAQRFSLYVSFVIWVLFLNPFFDSWIIFNLTGPIYWRLMWAIPLPILMSLLLTSPLQLGKVAKIRRPLVLSSFLASLIAFAYWLPTVYGISEKNRVEFKSPSLKVWEPTYFWADLITKSVPKGAFVAVPSDIGQWITTFHDHPYPLSVSTYLYVNRNNIEEYEFKQRHVMTRYVTGNRAGTEDSYVFKKGLTDLSIEAVCFWKSEYSDETRKILRSEGFSFVHGDSKRELWLMGYEFVIIKEGFESGSLLRWDREDLY